MYIDKKLSGIKVVQTLSRINRTFPNKTDTFIIDFQNKIEDIFDEIHRSNMSKLDESGKPIFREDGKVLKSNLYFRPDIAKHLK